MLRVSIPEIKTITIMRLIAKVRFSRLWIMVLLTGLSLVSVSVLSFAAKIGDSYGGGIVFYVDNSGQHGLIAAKADVPGHSPGKLDGEFTWQDAQVVCDNLVYNGFSDWFLPDREQLNQLYLQKSVVGGLVETYYWSSSESDLNNAWAQNFASGKQLAGSKANGSCVRAVRFF